MKSELQQHAQRGLQSRKRNRWIYQQRTLSKPFPQAFDSLVCEDSGTLRGHSITRFQSGPQ